MTVVSEGGEDGGGVKGEKAAKPVITVQDIYIFFNFQQFVSTEAGI